MKLYFSPMACSMATRISLYEAGADATYVEVDPKTKRTSEGEDYAKLNPLGLVPLLETDEGELLRENSVILQWVAERFPAAALAPSGPAAVIELRQWLSFISTELHKLVFAPLLDPKAPEAAKSYALEKSGPRLALLERHLAERDHLLEAFSIADAYLVTVLGWIPATPIEIGGFPALSRYVDRLRGRPSVARALSQELELYMKERQRQT